MKTTLSFSDPPPLKLNPWSSLFSTNSDPKETKKDTKKILNWRLLTPPCKALPRSAGRRRGHLQPFEINLLHKPAGLKAKRLLLVERRSGCEILEL